MENRKSVSKSPEESRACFGVVTPQNRLEFQDGEAGANTTPTSSATRAAGVLRWMLGRASTGSAEPGHASGLTFSPAAGPNASIGSAAQSVAPGSASLGTSPMGASPAPSVHDARASSNEGRSSLISISPHPTLASTAHANASNPTRLSTDTTNIPTSIPSGSSNASITTMSRMAAQMAWSGAPQEDESLELTSVAPSLLLASTRGETFFTGQYFGEGTADFQADRCAEFTVDTACKVDPGCVLECSVILKSDLVIVSGEVRASSSAKEILLTSEGFAGSLAQAIKDLIGPNLNVIVSLSPILSQPSTGSINSNPSPNPNPNPAATRVASPPQTQSANSANEASTPPIAGSPVPPPLESMQASLASGTQGLTRLECVTCSYPETRSNYSAFLIGRCITKKYAVSDVTVHVTGFTGCAHLSTVSITMRTSKSKAMDDTPPSRASDSSDEISALTQDKVLTFLADATETAHLITRGKTMVTLTCMPSECRLGVSGRRTKSSVIGTSIAHPRRQVFALAALAAQELVNGKQLCESVGVSITPLPSGQLVVCPVDHSGESSSKILLQALSNFDFNAQSAVERLQLIFGGQLSTVNAGHLCLDAFRVY